MKFSISSCLSFIYIVSMLQFTLASHCDNSNRVIRQEWNTLSVIDKNKYISAIKDLIKRKDSNQAIKPEIMSYHDFIHLHSTHTPWIHGDPMFLPFHRGMIRQFELAILSTKKWNKGLVYWDWSKKYNTWYNDDIFNYLGNVYHKNSYCVLNGNFSQNAYVLHTKYLLNNVSCLHRNNNETKKYNLISNDIINKLLLSAPNYKTFQGDDTTNYHAMIHVIVGGLVNGNKEGGDFANPYYSPIDPIFYFHHGMIDKIWYQWQTLNNNKNMFDYNDNKTENINYIPKPYSSIYNLPKWNVYNMLNLTNDILCYRYDNYDKLITSSKIIRKCVTQNNKYKRDGNLSNLSNYSNLKNYSNLSNNSIKIPKNAKIYKIYNDKISIIVNDTVKFLFINRTLPEYKQIDKKTNILHEYIIKKWQIDPYKFRVFYNKIN